MDDHAVRYLADQEAGPTDVSILGILVASANLLTLRKPSRGEHCTGFPPAEASPSIPRPDADVNFHTSGAVVQDVWVHT